MPNSTLAGSCSVSMAFRSQGSWKIANSVPALSSIMEFCRIAEALLATALGLVAAIPARARSTAHYRALIGDASHKS